MFEVEPAPGRRDDYLALAAALKPEFERIDGFVSVERFESLATPGKLPSLSFVCDETAVAVWRNRAGHRTSQAKGRAGIFTDCRLRVAAILRDYGVFDRAD